MICTIFANLPSSLQSIFKHRPLIQWTCHIHNNTHHRRSLSFFLGAALRGPTGTATTKDVNRIKECVNQLIETQLTQQETLVHVISILNVTRYAVQVNRHSINVLMDKMDETSQDVNNLYNLTTSLATSLSYQQIILYIRSVLANLRDSLSYIKTDYIDAATTGSPSPHIWLIMDLQRMLSHIEGTLPSTLHLPVSTEDSLHFYHYLWTHILIANQQYLLLINVPIQDRSQQLSIYNIFTLNILHGNFTAPYDISTKYLRITHDETMAVEISPWQFRIVTKQMDSCAPFLHHFKHLQTHHVVLLPCMSRTQPVFLPDQEIFRCQCALSTCTKCLDINNSTLSSVHCNYPHMPGRNNTVHWSKKTHPYIMSTHSLQFYITKFLPTPTIWRTTLRSIYFFGYGKPKHDISSINFHIW